MRLLTIVYLRILVMARTYYFGDLYCLLGSDIVSQLYDTISESGNTNKPFVLPFNGKEISFYLNKTQYGNGKHSYVDFDINNITNILFCPQPSEISVYYGTLGLICVDQFVNERTPLSKLIKDLKNHKCGLLFQIYSKHKLVEPKLCFEHKHYTFYHQVKIENELLFQILT